MPTMTVINFSHPFTDDNLRQIEALIEQKVEQVINVQKQFDNAQPFAEQARTLVESVGLSSKQWQTIPLVVNLPSFNVIAALVLAELHGRMGHFPAVLRLRPVSSSTPQFEVAEILNLQTTRDTARARN